MNSYNLPTQHQYVARESSLEQKLDPLSLMMSNRKELVLTKIALLAGQIYRRKLIHDEIADGIQDDELACLNIKNNKETAHDYLGAMEIEANQLLRLQKEKRSERAEYFRDTARLRKDLIEAMLEYKAADQRAGLMEGISGQESYGK